MRPFYKAALIEESTMSAADIVKSFPQLSLSEAEKHRQRVIDETKASDIFKNDEYQVVRRNIPDYEHGIGDDARIVHLSIRRLDRAPIHDWRALQQIKNELCGADREAIEIYPAEARLVDTANQYHLWVIDNPEIRIPLGWRTRNVCDVAHGGAVQRPREAAVRDAIIEECAQHAEKMVAQHPHWSDDEHDGIKLAASAIRELKGKP